MTVTIHNVTENTSHTYPAGSVIRVLSFHRSIHEAINCNPDRMTSFQRVPGHALAVMKFQRGGHYIIRFGA